MKSAEIKVGKTYINCGAGRTRRVVLGIGNEHRPNARKHSKERGRDEPGVLYEMYEQVGKHRGDMRFLYQKNTCLSSFAAWAGSEITHVNIDKTSFMGKAQ